MTSPASARSVLVFMCDESAMFPEYVKKARRLFPDAELTALGREASRQFVPSQVKFIAYPDTAPGFTHSMMDDVGVACTSYDVFVIPGFTGFKSHYNIVEIAVRSARNFVTLIDPAFEAITAALPVFDPEFPSYSAMLRHRFLRMEVARRRPPDDITTTRFVGHPYYGYVYLPNSTLDFSDNQPNVKCVAQIDKRGFRNSNPPDKKTGGEYWIGLYGGSVALSLGSSTNDTAITALMERKLNELLKTRPNCKVKRVRVFNFGLGGGNQPIQLRVFMGTCRDLDGIVTFDGHNEIGIPLNNRFRIPMDFPNISFHRVLRTRGMTEAQIALAWILRSGGKWVDSLPPLVKPVARRVFTMIRKRLSARLNMGEKNLEIVSVFGETRDTSNETITDFIRACADQWEWSMRLMWIACKGLGKDSLFILQPIMDKGKPLSSAEEALQANVPPERSKMFLLGHDIFAEELDKLANDGANCANFKDIFEGVTETVYWDSVHFGDLGCQIVGEKMAELVWSKFPAFGRD